MASERERERERESLIGIALLELAQVTERERVSISSGPLTPVELAQPEYSLSLRIA